LVALGLAEALVRALDLGPSFQVVFRESIQASANSLLDYELRPGARDGAQRISSDGLRDEEAVRPKPQGVFRVVAVGDSVTYGSGGERGLGWVERLEELLAEQAAPDAPRYEVWNLGVPGYNAAQAIERLRTAGLPLEPDAIVYAYVLNDPQAFSLEGAALRQMRAEAEGSTAGGGAPGSLPRLLARSRLYLWSRALLAAGPSPRRPASMPEDPMYTAGGRGDAAAYLRGLHTDPTSWRRVEESLDAFAALARQARSPALVAIFPCFGTYGESDSLADVHAQVAAAARARGLTVVDLLPVYAAARARLARPLEIDFLHPNPLGHRVAAHAVLAGLCKARALPPASGVCSASAAADGEIARVVAAALATP
jgi:lysophospholipase L1-like esterase